MLDATVAQGWKQAKDSALDLPGDAGVDLRAAIDPAPGHEPAAAPAERDPPVRGGAEVLDHGPRVRDALAARPADRFEHVGNRLGDHHVARGDGQAAAK